MIVNLSLDLDCQTRLQYTSLCVCLAYLDEHVLSAISHPSRVVPPLC